MLTLATPRKLSVMSPVLELVRIASGPRSMAAGPGSTGELVTARCNDAAIGHGRELKRDKTLNSTEDLPGSRDSRARRVTLTGQNALGRIGPLEL